MRRLIFTLLMFCLAGCTPAYFVSFSESYHPGKTLEFSLPAIVLNPGETRKAFLPAQTILFSRSSHVRIETEDPAVLAIMKPFDKNDISRLQAVAPGITLVHRGNFPFSGWNPKANPVQRAAWRASLRRYLHPRPDDVAFRAMSDADIWKTVLRSRSEGALRVVVERDRLDYQQR